MGDSHLAGSTRAWNHLGMNRRWVRGLLLSLAVATLSTGCGEIPKAEEMWRESEVFGGTAVLTAEETTAAVPFSLTFDGEAATWLGGVLQVEAQVVGFGDAADVGEVLKIERSIQDGTGVVQFVLLEQQAAPVEVRWEMFARTSGDPARQLFDRSTAAPVPELLVADLPTRWVDPWSLEVAEGNNTERFKRREQIRLDWGPTSPQPDPVATRFTLEVDSVDPLAVFAISPPYRNDIPPLPRSTELLVDGTSRIEIADGTRTTIEPPERCRLALPCQFDVVALSERAQPVELELWSAANLTVVAIEHEDPSPTD